MLDKQTFIASCLQYYAASESNYIPKEKALSDELISVKMFDEPIIAIAASDDARFLDLKKDSVIGEHLLLPKEWAPKAKSVISFFFPFTETIRNSNKEDMRYPSKGWFNGRIEGQHFINCYAETIIKYLNDNGYEAISPSIDKRLFINGGKDNKGIGKLYTSNWSERHAAFICGIGTFSLSKGLISEKGAAGRLTSIITELYMSPDNNSFTRFDENCIMCGKCIKNCPVGAISFENGKNHEICDNFLNSILAEHSPWYGCGKCQVNVPCEFRNPSKAHLSRA